MRPQDKTPAQPIFRRSALSQQVKIASLSLCLCGGLAATTAIAQTDNQALPSPEAVASQTVSFNIPAQAINSALFEFTRQSRAQVVLSEGVSAAGLNSVVVNGDFSPQSALEALLAGTGLVVQQASSGDFVLSNGGEPLSMLEEVLVQGSYVTDKLDTGTGLGLSLHETPQSVSIMTFQRIEDQNLASLTDIVNNTAGISAKETDSSRSRFAARGFDIRTYQIDGVPFTWTPGWNAGETALSAALYERVEVVRGATGLLSGVGDPSASINLVRKHADSREFTGSSSFGVSRWNNYEANIDLSAGLNSEGSIRGRIVIDYEEGDSHVDLAANKTSTFYAVIGADLTDDTLLRLGASYQDNDPTSSTWGGLPIWFRDGTRTNWSRSKTKAANWTYWASTNETYFMDLTHVFSNGWDIKLNASHSANVADERLLWVTGTLFETTGLGLTASPRRYDSDREQDDFGLRLAGSFQWLGRKHELVFGMTYSQQDHLAVGYERGEFDLMVGNFYQWDGSYAEPEWGARSMVVQAETTQKGYYAASRLALTDSLKLIMGARVADWDTKGVDFGVLQDYGDDGVVIPYFGMLYDINDTHTIYVSYTEIFQPQSEMDGNGKLLDPLVGQSYETGLKSAFFDGALSTTVTLFRIEQDNLAVLEKDVYLPSNPDMLASRGAQGTVSKGYEIEVVGELLTGWDVSFSFTDFSLEEGSEVNPTEPQSDVNTHQPRNLLRLFSTYHFSGALENFTIGGGVNWEKGTYTDVKQNPGTGQPERLEQKSYSLVNLMAGYDFSNQLSVQANVSNLLDETYYSQIGFYNQLAYGEPRNINVSLKYQF